MTINMSTLQTSDCNKQQRQRDKRRFWKLMAIITAANVAIVGFMGFFLYHSLH